MQVRVGSGLVLWSGRVVAWYLLFLGATLGAAHGTLLSTLRLLGMRTCSACFHSRPPIPVINRLIASTIPCPLLLPQLLVLISVVCPPGPTNSSSLQKLAICCSSCQQQRPNHHSHSPPIVPAAFSTNHSARPNVSSARQPRPLLRPPLLEGRLIL